MQQFTMKACIHAPAPYLRPLLKMDNLPLICKHVSGNVLHAILDNEHFRRLLFWAGFHVGFIMVGPQEEFSSQVNPELLEGIRGIARKEGRYFQAVLEDAMSAYIESKKQERVRPEFMGHLVQGSTSLQRKP